LHNESLLEYISKVDELMEVNDFLKEDFVEVALSNLVKLAVKPDLPQHTARTLIVELQAISGIFSIKATYFSTLSRGKTGSLEFNSKNLYYTLAKVFEDMVSALKYQAKSDLG
jgi:hypothetical protein